MSWQFGRIDLDQCEYKSIASWDYLTTPPVDTLLKIYQEYCRHKHFRSVMPMIPGRFFVPGTEIIGYHDNDRLVAWSMYRIWDDKNVLSDHFAWDYKNPGLRLGVRSLENECAIYRDRGYRWMYFESVEPYMLDIQGFEILGAMT